ncbi:MAG: type II toxin-antitoxin system YafQ family toxin [Candidatus Aminicenantes bacterium]|nr:type II toxin-antitoxin system YafQ family toxin [Candidatus Aminicenantes bacterium]
MLEPVYTNRFKKDLKRVKRRKKDTGKLKAVMLELGRDMGLDPQYQDHKLGGRWAGRRECHIEPDWLLIYKIDVQYIIFERTGSHADLF